MVTTSRAWRGLGVIAVLIGMATAARAEEGEAPRLSIHGFVTQAYAVTDGNQYFGIPNSGTTDYRRAALQARYDVADETFLIQLNHRRLGASPSQALSENIELGQAFWQHKFSSVYVKAGRIPLPLGIYNEARFLGTSMPFYRPPTNVYGDQTFTTESVDGAAVGGTLDLGAGFGLDASAYYGGWDYPETDGVSFVKARAQDGAGAQLWLNTPIDGLRLGVHGQRMTLRGGLFRPVGKIHEDVWDIVPSIDASFERFMFRSEALIMKYETGYYHGWYAQAGLKLVGELRANGQVELGNWRYTEPAFGLRFAGRYDTDYATSLTYDFGASVRVKAEHHWNRGYNVEEPINIFADPPRRTRIVVVSLSAAF